MKQLLCLARCFLAYTTLCGVVMVAFGMCDLSTCFPVLPPIHLQQRMDWLSILPERLNFCSLDIFNESESARIVVRQQQLSQQQQSLPKPQSPQQQLSPQVSWPLPFFDPHHSTEENYRDDQGSLVGRYASIRKELDYSYHNIYSQERQLLQDSILSAMLERTQQLPCTDHVDEGVAVVAQSPATEQTSWVVFTAGVMGAGKTHTIKWLADTKGFPLPSFVWVDPDQIRHCLPEFEVLVRHEAGQAGERTRKEAGMLSEVLIQAALKAGKSVIVDGSLRDRQWYQDYFHHLRHDYPGIRIAILHVTAPRTAVLERAASRARTTGRVVPEGLLRQAMVQVPESVAVLRHEADFFVELHNAGIGDVEIVQPLDLDWQGFRQQWAGKTCDPVTG